jgi:hypothetical protein
MLTTLKWQVRVIGAEQVENVLEFATDALRGLVASEMVPETAKVDRAGKTFGGLPEVVVEWETQSEMANEPNYAA